MTGILDPFAGTVGDNIAAGRPGATTTEIQAAARAAGCHDDIVAFPVGYEALVGEAGYTLSGGCPPSARRIRSW